LQHPLPTKVRIKSKGLLRKGSFTAKLCPLVNLIVSLLRLKPSSVLTTIKTCYSSKKSCTELVTLPEFIETIYENGVLKPLKPIDLKEHERVEIIITSKSRWASEFKKLLDIVHERTKKFTSEEIEADITQAYREVQQK